ncbi:putative retrotransposon hot spot (RHS) protein [Trypanosoma cruzi]|uniref:Putative retrotransposon hot spot (RHS) protein n=1 Tax=Trypanosoma cruzi TaxID=5693 RepID=A0A2V2UIC7_TRYCR|nr:putative retrotransposon hot spot (RHS) protein [Trypanosoma cruzi]
MIVVTPPDKNNYESWAKLVRAKQIIMNCPEENDVKAMCVWMKHNRQLAEEEAEYWKEVRGRMNKVGPLLRYIFDDSEYNDRIDSCESTVKKLNLFDNNYYSILGTNEVCDDSHISHKLVRIVRVRGRKNSELPLNALVSSYLGNLVTCKLAELIAPNDFILLVLALMDDLLSKALEKYSVFTSLSEAFVNAIIPETQGAENKKNAPPHLCALELRPHERPLKPCLLRCLENLDSKINIEYRVLYKPVAQNFPLVDAFFFLDSNPMTVVGLRMTTAGGHHTTASTVRQFTECLAEYFEGWEESSQGLSWEIIYVQQADSTPMNDWQRCDVVDANNVSDAEHYEIAAFWREKARQYRAAVSSADARRKKALRGEEKRNRRKN